MAGVNKVILVGNLGRDPEVRNMQNGGKIVNMTLATSQTWKDRQTGERQERVEWHRVVIFNENLANNAERYLRKGSQVYVEGELRTRKWTDQSGMERYTTEVVIDRFRGELTFLSTRNGDDNGGGGSYGDSYGGATPRASSQSDSSYNGGAQKPQQPTQHYGQQAPQQNQGWDASSSHDDFDDEIPF